MVLKEQNGKKGEKKKKKRNEKKITKEKKAKKNICFGLKNIFRLAIKTNRWS
jgi:translation elongation factor EF-1beta